MEKFIQKFQRVARRSGYEERPLVEEFKREIMSYASPLVRKLHLCGRVTSKIYKPAFHGGYLSCNTSYGGAANLRVFCLPR